MASAQQFNDADWNHLEQTMKMLSLAIVQIETALHEGNHEAATIGASFSDIHEQTKQLQNAKVDIDTACQSIQQSVQNAVVAFQFYDRLSQRVDHVQNGLRKMVDIIADHRLIQDPDEWQRSQDEIKASYTMEAERLMFDKIMHGAQLDDVLQIYRHNFANAVVGEEEESGDIIELF